MPFCPHFCPLHLSTSSAPPLQHSCPYSSSLYIFCLSCTRRRHSPSTSLSPRPTPPSLLPPPCQVRFHPCRPHIVASGSLDHEVRLWDTLTAACLVSHQFCESDCCRSSVMSCSFNVPSSYPPFLPLTKSLLPPLPRACIPLISWCPCVASDFVAFCASNASMNDASSLSLRRHFNDTSLLPLAPTWLLSCVPSRPSHRIVSLPCNW